MIPKGDQKDHARWAKRIQDYWAGYGCTVRVNIVREVARDGGYWAVRSDMVDGLPVQKKRHALAEIGMEAAE